MIVEFTEKWWIHLIRGLAAITIGCLALFRPVMTLNLFLVFFAAFLIVDGMITGFMTFLQRRYTTLAGILYLVEGFLGLVLGLIVLAKPQIALLTLVYLLGAWALITGIIRTWWGFRSWLAIRGDWISIPGGIISVLIGILLFLIPQSAVVAIIWLFAVSLILTGGLLVYMSFELRKIQTEKAGISSI